MSDQPLPHPLPAKIPVRIFDWKPYVRALVWMVTAAVFISFVTIILVPRSQAIVEDSGLIVNDRIGAFIALANNGGSWILTVAGLALPSIAVLSEAVCKGTWSRRVRSWGCGIISYCTIIATILLFLSHAVIVGVFAPVTAVKLESYRDFSAQIGVLDAIEKQNAIVRTDGASFS